LFFINFFFFSCWNMYYILANRANIWISNLKGKRWRN
jgi:hypothetical protein